MAKPELRAPESSGRPAAKPRDLMSRFNLAFGLMSVIPLLTCFYLITVRLFSISILEGMNGFYFVLALVIALLGLLAGQQLIRDIIRQLVESNTKLQRLYNQQASFVSNVAHEFRSPLTIVKGSLDNLADGLHGPLRQGLELALIHGRRFATAGAAGARGERRRSGRCQAPNPLRAGRSLASLARLALYTPLLTRRLR